MKEKQTMLCLGDSYTIGQSVESNRRFPEQTIALLNKNNLNFGAPEIIARTGWTTADLINAIERDKPDNNFDFVTLLIGVNDEFQGLGIEEYKSNFELLLKKSIEFAAGKNQHVIAISIPDYGVTPFAERSGMSPTVIADRIDTFNRINKSISEKYKVNYIDITEISRNAQTDGSLLADDGLHPSGKMYAQWAELIAAEIKSK